MTVRDALSNARLALSGITEESRFEAGLLLKHITGLSSALVDSSAELSPEQEELLDALLRRRLSREPLQYILGEWSFYGLDFRVTPAALIPRQDTEILVEEAIRLIRERGYRSLLDICTGTGCIAAAIAKNTGAAAEASDISEDCVSLARENAERNGVSLTVRRADLFEGAGKYDIITANPPYINAADMRALQPEVRFEPALALAGGEDGLDIYRRIAGEAFDHINNGGALLLEVGYNEADAVAELFVGRRTRAAEDLNGIERVVIIED